MGDPLSPAASVAGIAAAAISSIKFLVQVIDNVKGAPDTIKSVRTDLNGIHGVLEELCEATKEDNPLQIVISNQIRVAVANCNRACGTFRLQVEHWMERSTEDKMFWVDRWKVGLFGLQRINTFRGQLSDCKSTLTVALSTATVITTTRQEHTIQGMKDDLKKHQVEVKEEIARATYETREIELSIQQLPTSINNALTATFAQLQESEQSRKELLYELEQHKAANQAFVNMCHEALHQTKEQRTVQRINNNKVTNNSRMLTGFMNATAEQSKIDQHISDNIADNYSIAVAGVANNIDFSNFVSQRP